MKKTLFVTVVLALVSGCVDRSSNDPAKSPENSVQQEQRDKVSAEEVKRKVVDAARGIRDLAQQEFREQYEKAQPEMDRLKGRIEELRAKAKAEIKSPENRKRIEAEVEKLEQKYSEAEARLREWGKKGAESSEKIGDRVRDLLGDLNDSYRRTAEEVEGNSSQPAEKPDKP